jgi:hypothetical protein
LRFQPDSPLGKNDHGSGNFAGWLGVADGSRPIMVSAGIAAFHVAD